MGKYCDPYDKKFDSAASCMNCLKRNFSIFKYLSHNELEILNRNRSTVIYKNGESVYKQGTKLRSLFCLSHGKVKITHSGIGGSEQILFLKKPVDLLGLEELMRENTCHSSAVALEDCTVCLIDRKDFLEILNDNNSLAQRIIRQLSEELARSNDRIVNLTQKHMRARVADTLLLVQEVYGVSTTDQCLDVTLKRSDVAALSNMTTANAIRTLSDFTKSNLIGLHNRRISIKKPGELRKISLLG